MVQQPATEFDPVVDLQRFLQFASGTAQVWQDQLSQAQAALNRLEAAADADAAPLVLEPLTAETTRAILPHLVSTARGTVRSYVMDLDGGPAGADEVGLAGQDRIRSGRPFWTLYPSTILGTTEGISFTSGRAAWGEVQRVCPATQTQFVLLGDDLVLTVAAWGDPSQGYVLVREPLVVAAFGPISTRPGPRPDRSRDPRPCPWTTSASSSSSASDSRTRRSPGSWGSVCAPSAAGSRG